MGVIARRAPGWCWIAALAALALPLQASGSPGSAAAAVASSAPVAPHTLDQGVVLPVQQGHLLLIGGALGEQRTILERFVRLADLDGDGPHPARVAVVTASSYPAQTEEEASDPEEENATTNGRYYVDQFERFGADAWPVPIDEAVNYPGDPYVPANSYDPDVVRAVRASTAVFLGGGDQMRYLRSMLECEPAPDEALTDCVDTPVVAAIRSVLDRGGVVAGTSAGLTVQQRAPMITGGQPYESWRGGARPGYYEGRRLGYVPHGGFGFFREAMLDSHFSTWGRQVRMVRLAMDERVGYDRIVGVDETTALVVDRATGKARVIGRNGVSVLDVSDARLDGTTVAGVRWSYLTRGDRFDVDTWRVRPGRGSSDLVGDGPPPPLQDDIWDSVDAPNVYSLRDLGVALVESAGTRARGVTLENDPRYETTLVVRAPTEAWRSHLGRVGFADLAIRVQPLP